VQLKQKLAASADVADLEQDLAQAKGDVLILLEENEELKQALAQLQGSGADVRRELDKERERAEQRSFRRR
jgi:hypothetical protein